MDAKQLRDKQQPLKQRYREKPEVARIPARAEARLAKEDVACTVAGWAGEVRAGLHPAAGGDGSQACSADMLLEALAACAGVTLNSVATAMGVTLRDGWVVAEGEWDARGTLALAKEVPVGLRAIRLSFEIDSDADDATLGRLVELTERFCVIYQTLVSPPEPSAEFRRMNV